jgi:hypothetical protein
MNDAFLCRYANQDIRMLRGVPQLTDDEKLVLALCTGEWLRREVEPLDPPSDPDASSPNP